MRRVVKRPEVRRAEILDAAFQIFLDRGYDNTSLNEIIASAGLSKGMFYHHFSSKEALLEELFERITEESYHLLEPVISAEGLDAVTRLQGVLDRAAEIRMQSVQVTRSVFTSLLRPESRLLYDRVTEAWAARMRPVLTLMIERGVEEGAFDTCDPEGVANVILHMGESTRYLLDRGMAAGTRTERNRAVADLRRRLRFHAVALARILGLPDGTFSIGPRDFATNFMKALNPLPRTGSGNSERPESKASVRAKAGAAAR